MEMSERHGGSSWIDNLLRPALLAAMMACLASPLIRVLEWMVPGWEGTYFLAFCFVAGLEAILSERALQAKRITGWGYVSSRGAELLVLLMVLKVVNYIPWGLDQLWMDARLWLRNPDSLITLLDLVTGLSFLVLWGGAITAARQVLQLDVDEWNCDPPADKTSPEYYLWLTQPSVVGPRQEAMTWMAETFLWGGLAVVVASAAIHFLVPHAAPPVLPILLYFALGLALLSQAQFSVAHGGWRVQGLAIQGGIARRWLLWAALFLVGVAGLALLLPTRYSLGPALALIHFLGLVYRAALVLFSLGPYFLVLLLSILFPGVEEPPLPPPARKPGLPLEGLGGAGGTHWSEILVSGFFWTIMVVIMGYALARFLVDRVGLRMDGDEGQDSWWGRLLGWLRMLGRRWRAWRRGVHDQLAARGALRGKPRASVGGFPFLSLRRLPPTALIRYFFLSIAQRAAKAGRPRGPGQTPYEYQASLDDQFGDLEPDLTDLTNAFVRARYSPRKMNSGDVNAAKPPWRRLKALLRKHRVGPR